MLAALERARRPRRPGRAAVPPLRARGRSPPRRRCPAAPRAPADRAAQLHHAVRRRTGRWTRRPGWQDTPAVRGHLAGAVQDLRGAGLPLNATLRRVQIDKPTGIADPRRARRPGRVQRDHLARGTARARTPSTTAPASSWPRSSCTGACGVKSSTFVTYGQSENPDSPHRSDYTRAFRDKRWNHMAFCADEVLAAPQTVSYVGNSCVPRGGLTAASVKGTRRGVRVGFRRARKARVSVRIYRVTRKGLRRVASYSRAKSFTIKRGPAEARAPTWRGCASDGVRPGAPAPAGLPRARRARQAAGLVQPRPAVPLHRAPGGGRPGALAQADPPALPHRPHGARRASGSRAASAWCASCAWAASAASATRR